MARHSRPGFWAKIADRLLGDDETREDNRAYRESQKRYRESKEYQDSLMGFKDIMKLVGDFFRRNRHGRH